MPIFLMQNTYIIDHIKSNKRDNIYLGLVFKEKSYSNIITSGIARKSPVHKLPGSTAIHENSWSTVSRIKQNTTANIPKCHFCGISGHMRRQCKFGDYIRCFKCNAKGHKARFCEK